MITFKRSLRPINHKPTTLGSNSVVLTGARIYESSIIGKSLIMGHNAIIREECSIGDNFKLWNNSVVDYGCTIGNNVKIHCNCYIAQYTIIEDDVFIAPGVITTNDKYPGTESSAHLIGPTIKKGAQIGAGSVILPWVVIGEGALIGSGSVVTKDVPSGETWFGNPAKVSVPRQKKTNKRKVG